eukprot:scaffold6339_cov112-Isochrysis_galbana.AAC.10
MEMENGKPRMRQYVCACGGARALHHLEGVLTVVSTETSRHIYDTRTKNVIKGEGQQEVRAAADALYLVASIDFPEQFSQWC